MIISHTETGGIAFGPSSYLIALCGTATFPGETIPQYAVACCYEPAQPACVCVCMSVYLCVSACVCVVVCVRVCLSEKPIEFKHQGKSRRWSRYTMKTGKGRAREWAGFI